MTTSSGRKHADPASDQPAVPEPAFAERARTRERVERLPMRPKYITGNSRGSRSDQ